MENNIEILKQCLSEQIALEEHLCRIIEEQISEIDETDFEDAKNLLKKTSQVLENHFLPLNTLLDKFEKDALNARGKVVAGNGRDLNNILAVEQRNTRISRILRDDYSALNLITISNTLLHTTALALDAQEVAAIALKHLKNLVPLVIKIGCLVPDVVTRELCSNSSSTIDLSVALTAMKNTQLAWRNAS